MNNPWQKIKKDNYVLSIDKDRINEFNKNESLPPKYKIQDHLIPDPFFGNKKAKVVLLMLNPGFGGKEDKDYEQNNFEKILLKNLKHSNTRKHFFSLDNAFEGTDAHNYWKPRVKELNDFNDKEFDNNFLSEHLFCINLFPYHSKEYKKIKGGLLESQKYALYLLNEKIQEKDSLIISMRSYKPWAKAYSDEFKNAETFDVLVKRKKMLIVKNPLNPTLSQKNLLQKDETDGFKILKDKLKESL
ncbi:hypothetical protein [Ferruginibacter sp.]|uniref:hypothetical protein n=1 Tax=Ferruginibacter sp. TaxID=1940288 RepID=UPI0019C455CA|nr:hypothetical protein [Ferruginibacter sp.]MBC7629196.1 hypothetical protein [Ferruginibacter sp.]